MTAIVTAAAMPAHGRASRRAIANSWHRGEPWDPTRLAVGGRSVAFFVPGMAYTDAGMATAAGVGQGVYSMRDGAALSLTASNATENQRPERKDGAVRVGVVSGTSRGLEASAFASSVSATAVKGVALLATPSGASSTNPTTAANFLTGASSATFGLQINAAGTHWRSVVRGTAGDATPIAAGAQSVILEQTGESSAYVQVNGGARTSVSAGADANDLTRFGIGNASVASQSYIDGGAWVFWWGGSPLSDSEREALNDYLAPAQDDVWLNSRTLVARSSTLAYFVAQRKAQGSGGLLFLCESGVTTTSQSLGVDAELTRVTNVFELVEVVAFKAHSSVSSAGDWTKTTPTYPNQAAGTAINDGTRYNRTTVQNAWIEYSVDVPADGNLRIGFYGTSGASTSVRVAVDGSTVDTFSLATSPSHQTVVKTYSVTPGTRTVRVTKLDAGTAGLQVFGPNFYCLSNLHTATDGSGVDAFGYFRTGNIYITNKGASDYAIYSDTASLWGGSYHGGETSVSFSINSQSGPISLAAGEIYAGSWLRFRQETLIDWANGETLSVDIETRFGTGGYELVYTMTGSVVVQTVFSVMSTTPDTFDEVTFPVTHTFTNTGTDLIIGECLEVTQRNATTGQTITNSFSSQNLAYNDDGAWIKESVGQYNKLYYGPIYGISEGVPVTYIAQTCAKRFA